MNILKRSLNAAAIAASAQSNEFPGTTEDRQFWLKADRQLLGGRGGKLAFRLGASAPLAQ